MKLGLGKLIIEESYIFKQENDQRPADYKEWINMAEEKEIMLTEEELKGVAGGLGGTADVKYSFVESKCPNCGRKTKQERISATQLRCTNCNYSYANKMSTQSC